MTTAELSAADAQMVGSIIESKAAPLNPAERNFLESRFGVSFGHLRLHTGPHAASAAARLGARAFSFGRHIVFGANEYQPRSAAGMRLLAHELAHVVQQGDESFGSRAMRLGAPDDPLEREADVVAQRIALPERLPTITRGAPAALRRVIIIKAPATTGVDVIRAGVAAEPSTQVGALRNQVSFNLRRNFNSSNPPQSGVAFTFSGHVGVTFDPGDPVGDFTFGWLQFMRQIALRFVYVGREDGEGQIEIEPLPLIGTGFLIDRSENPTAAAFSPFVRDPAGTRFDADSKEVIADLGDHPMVFLPERRHNFTTGVDNFLFSVLDHREAVSIFVVRDKFARFTPLAQVNWDLLYNGTFRWRNREILETTNGSSFTVNAPVKGAPTDNRINSLLAKLSPTMAPLFNLTAQNAVRTAANPPPHANRRDLDHREGQIPALFFLEGPGSLDIP